MARILLVDDEPSILSVLTTLLKTEGYEVFPALGGEKARDLLDTETFDLMIADIRMSPVNGMDLLRQVNKEGKSMAVIMLTAHGSIETAIEAMRLGAFDYITKPFKVDELLITVQRALQYHQTLHENADLRARLETRYQLDNIVAESPSMKAVCEMIRRVAPTDTTVLIYGESGTGKELVARAIHNNSPRRNKNFLAVNCAALPEPLLESEMFGHVKGAFTGAASDKEGLFEAADGGTLLLDEIGSMPLTIQGKLLRVLQEKEVRRVGSNKNIPVNVRVIAATNTPLEELVKQGKCREDLYYRLSVIPITIDPLRKRPEDILPLVHHFIRKEIPSGRPLPKIDPEVCRILESYPWPGNVRELENAIKHALTFAENNTITKDVLPPKIASTELLPTARGPLGGNDASKCQSLKAFLRKKEMEYLNYVLELCNGDKAKAAQLLKISLATLYRKLPETEKEGSASPNPSAPRTN
ncbi:MAG: sigma-54 dependent transcriptional regulator [Kiritimatiellae bacterium]|nr:sigma-54 dependent transcriptional regulator [Kiritimatiellia bacterium]